MLQSLRGGLRYVLGDELIGPSLGATATINLFNFVFHAIFILFATEELGVSPGVLGIALGIGAVGGIIGALVAVRLERVIGIGPAFTLGCVLFPAPLVLVPIATGSELMIALMLGAAEFLSAVGVMILDVNGNSLMLLRTPDRLRSRMGGTYPLRQLRRPAARSADRRRARNGDRPRDDPLDRRTSALSAACSGSSSRRSRGCARSLKRPRVRRAARPLAASDFAARSRRPALALLPRLPACAELGASLLVLGDLAFRDLERPFAEADHDLSWFCLHHELRERRGDGFRRVHGQGAGPDPSTHAPAEATKRSPPTARATTSRPSRRSYSSTQSAPQTMPGAPLTVPHPIPLLATVS